MLRVPTCLPACLRAWRVKFGLGAAQERASALVCRAGNPRARHTPPPATRTPCARSDRPVPIPAPGIQLVGISHVDDLAAMLAKVSE